MRILVHDFSGHPFQVQLSRALARRGHEVLHVDCASYATGKGDLSSRDDPKLSVHSIELGARFDKYSVRRRFQQEAAYGRRFTRLAQSFGPDVLLSSNDPLVAKWVAGRWCRRTRTPWVFWLQDIYSVAMSTVAGRLPLLGRAMGATFRRMEQQLLREASAVVAISADFLPRLDAWNIDRAKVTVIENWAPVDELPVRPRHNAWSAEHGLDDATVFLYAGTLGMKHDPDLLVAIARRFRARADVRVVVASEGVGADYVRGRAAEEGLRNVVVLPFQPYERLPDTLATGDVLLVILEPDAGVFSVPSKVLSYHCAQRPLLASVPSENLAARIIESQRSGVVVPPGDAETWATAAEALLADPERRAALGANARAYAERAFDIDAITDRFETVLRDSAGA
jgi:glycosyltransferase involved in cell wall biosynthesis